MMVRRFTPKVGGRFTEILERKSKEFNALRKKERRSMYASDFGQCMRKVFYLFYPELFDGEEITGKVARIFANGEDVHFRLSAYLSTEDGLEFTREVNVPRDGLNVHGRCDGVGTHDARFFVLEFKSINKQEVLEPKDEHVGQLMWYLGMFEMVRKELRKRFELKEEDVVFRDFDESLSDVERKLLMSQGPVRGSLIYESKPSQSIYEFPIEYDEKKFAEVRHWFEELKSHVESGVRPKVRYKETRYPCQWGTGRCPYFKYCYGLEQVQDDHVVVQQVELKRLDVPVVEKVRAVPERVQSLVSEELRSEAEEVEKEEEGGESS